MQPLRKFFTYEKRAFYHLNQQFRPQNPTKFAKPASWEIQYLKSCNIMMEQSNARSVEGRISEDEE